MMPRLAVVPELETELDRLYSLPLEEFTAARNELASRLRKAGQVEAADNVHALRKPSVAVWAVNQLGRRHAKDVGALVDAGERLRHAQQQALAGEGAAGVRTATTDERAAVRGLTRLAEQVLADEGRLVTRPTLERIAATLRAAAVDPVAAALLGAGRLPDEVESSGFGPLASLAPPARRRTGRKPADDRVDVAERQEHAQRLRRLKKRAEQLRRKEAEAKGKAERAERAAVQAHSAAEAAGAAAKAAESELAEAEADTE